MVCAQAGESAAVQPRSGGGLLVGVVGGTCSGKSTLAGALARELAPVGTARLCFDSYYRPIGHLPESERAAVNFDHPDSLDQELFEEHLRGLAAGEFVQEPVYDFASHARLAQTRRVAPAPFVLVDGILVLAVPSVAELLDWSVFLRLDEGIRLQRRIARDAVQRGRTEQSVRAQFAATVAPMHRRFVAPSAERAARIVDGTTDLDRLATELAAELMALRAERLSRR